jgi:hypothetical protein
MTLSLAFLAPEIVKAAIEGRLPRGFGLKRLVDLPMGWLDQWRTLGLQARERRRNERSTIARLSLSAAPEEHDISVSCAYQSSPHRRPQAGRNR